MLFRSQLIDLNVAHYELWRKELSKVDIKNSTKNDIQKFIKIVLNWETKMYGFNTK